MAEKKLISELLGEDDIFKMAELNAILTDALDTLDSAFIILRDEICVFENTGFRRILGLDEKDTFKGKSGEDLFNTCLLYTSPSPRDQRGSRMPSSA